MTAESLFEEGSEARADTTKGQEIAIQRAVENARNDSAAVQNIFQTRPTTDMQPLERKEQDTRLNDLFRFAQEGNQEQFTATFTQMNPQGNAEQAYEQTRKLIELHQQKLELKKPPELTGDSKTDTKKWDERLQKIGLINSDLLRIRGETPTREKKDELAKEDLQAIRDENNLSETQSRDMLRAAYTSGFASQDLVFSLQDDWNIPPETREEGMDFDLETDAGEQAAVSVIHMEIMANIRGQTQALRDIFEQTSPNYEEYKKKAQESEAYQQLREQYGDAIATAAVQGVAVAGKEAKEAGKKLEDQQIERVLSELAAHMYAKYNLDAVPPKLRYVLPQKQTEV